METNQNEVQEVRKAGKLRRGGKVVNDRGVRRVVTSRGEVVFDAQVRIKGHPHQSGRFKTKEEALRWKERTTEELRSRKSINRTTLGDCTLTLGDRLDPSGKVITQGVFSLYMDKRNAEGRLSRTVEDVYRRLALHPVLKDVMVRDVDAHLAEEFCKARQRGVNHTAELRAVDPSTVKVEFIRAALAIRELGKSMRWGSFNPWDNDVAKELTALGLLSESAKRSVRPTGEQLDAIFAELKAWEGRTGKYKTTYPIHDIVLVAVNNAFRRNELCKLRWSDLDVDNSVIRCWNRKDSSRKARRVMNKETGELGAKDTSTLVPLIGDTLDVLLRQPRGAHIKLGVPTEGVQPGSKEDLIFPCDSQTIGLMFRKACRRLGFHGLRFHDLRHEAISRLPEIFTNTAHMMLVSGHKTESNLRRYINFTVEDVAAVAKMGRKLKRSTGNVVPLRKAA